MRLLKPGWVHHDEKPIFSVDVHQDCQKFATGGQGNDTGRVVIWNLLPVLSEKAENDPSVPKMLCQMDQHLACVNCVRWSQNGQLLASGSDDKLIMIWRKSQGSSGVFGTGGMQKNHESWKCFYTLRGHAGDVLDLAWSSNDRYLASCSVDNTVIVWDAHSFPLLVATLKGHTGLVKGVSWDPVGKFLASQSDDRSIKVWKTSDWSCNSTITEPFEECGGTTHILRLSWSPDGQYLVSAHAINGGGPTAQIIEREGWKCDKDFVGHRKAVTCVRFHNSILKRHDAGSSSPTKPLHYCCLAVGSRDRSLSVWMTALQRPMIVIHELFNDSILDLSWGTKQCLLMACSGDGSVACLQFTDDELGTSLSEEENNLIFQRIYGKTIENGLTSTGTINAVVENPELLGCAQEWISAPKLTNECFAVPNGALEKRTASTASSTLPAQSSTNKAISKQTETRTKDGRRRITPMFIPTHEQASQEQTQPSSIVISKVSTTDAVTTSALEPRLSMEDQGRLDSRLKLVPATQRHQPMQFDAANLENFPRHLNNQPVRKPADHQGSTIGPKLNITASSKCEYIKAAMEYRIHVQNGHLKTSFGMVAKVSALMHGERIWEMFVGSPVVNLNLCSKYVMLCSLDGSMRLLAMDTGCAVFPTISLSSVAVHCAFSPNNGMVGILTECGLLRIWHIAHSQVTLAAGCTELLGKHGTAVQFAVTDTGMPLIGFPNGHSYSYSISLQSWLVLSSKDAITFNGIRATLPRDQQRFNRHFPLLTMQANAHNYINLSNTNEINPESWQHSAKIIFIDNQIKLCEALHSPEELKHWHLMMAFHLASQGAEPRLRLYLDQLLNQTGTKDDQLPKDELFLSVLDTIRPHIRWQRLHMEYMELYKFCRSERKDIFIKPGAPVAANTTATLPTPFYPRTLKHSPSSTNSTAEMETS